MKFMNSYEKNHFLEGQFLKAYHLNHLEEGISASSVKTQRITMINNAMIILEDNTEYIATADLTTLTMNFKNS